MQQEVTTNDSTTVDTGTMQAKSMPANTQIEIQTETTKSEVSQQTTEQQQQQATNNQQATDNQQTSDDNIIERRKQVEQDLAQDLERRGVNFDNIAQELEATGTLSTETLKKLEDAGYPKSVVDNYIQGMEADADRFVSAIISKAGGEESLAQIQDYVANNYTDQQIQALNDTIMGGNMAQIELMLAGIRSQMGNVNGTFGRTLVGSTGGGNSDTNGGFSSKQEMMKAMNDPRYGRDRQYTLEVEQKVQRATFF